LVWTGLLSALWLHLNPLESLHFCSSASPLAYPQLGWLAGWSHGRASLTRSFTWVKTCIVIKKKKTWESYHHHQLSSSQP
jgi:hypothetical protein